MLALHHHSPEVPGQHAAAAGARREVDRLQGGLSRALLSTSPEVVRVVADRAARAEAVAARRRALVGDRPPLDEAAEAAVVAAEADHRAARRARDEGRWRVHVLVARGNCVGLGALSLASGLYLSGMHVMAAPIAAAMMVALAGPLVAAALCVRSRRATAAALTSAGVELASALEATGLTTMGALAARRLALAGWQRRCREAEVAEAAAARHRRAWQRLAGPGVPAEQVDAVVDRLAELRAAQLRLLAVLVEQRLRSTGPVEREDRSWLDEALERIRGRKLHLWLSG